MNASTLKKIGMVLLVLAAFFILIKVNDDRAKHFHVNAKTFHVKSTKNTLLQTEFKFMPLLEPANQYHIMMNENVDVPLVNMRRTLHIEKAWLHPDFLYVLYSVDMKKSDQTLADVPQLQFSKIQFHFKDGKTLDVTTTPTGFQAGSSPNLRSTYDHKVYGEVLCGIPFNPQVFKARNIEAVMNKIKQIDKVTLINPTILLKEQKSAVDAITFPIQLNQDKYYVSSQPINKKIQVKGATIRFNQIKTYYDHSELDYQTVANPNHLLNIEFDVKPKGSNQPQGDRYVVGLELDSHSTLLSETKVPFAIQPKKVEYKLDKPIKIQISSGTFKKLLKSNSEKKVADLPNGSIYFGFDQEKDPSAFYLGIKRGPNKEPQINDINLISKKQASAMSQSTINQVTLISITTLEGDAIDAGMSDQIFSKNGEIKSFFRLNNLDKLDQGLNIELDGLIYEQPVDSAPITISSK